MKTIHFFLAILFFSSLTFSQTSEMSMHSEKMRVISADQLEWKDGPGSLPPGAKFTMLEGDMSKEGPFTVRLWMPANFNIAPHTHPGVEHVTVIKGTFYLGMGKTFEKSAGQKMVTGDFAFMQPGMQHFAWTDTETIIQLHGIGPWAINYINPQDDPRKTKQ